MTDRPLDDFLQGNRLGCHTATFRATKISDRKTFRRKLVYRVVKESNTVEILRMRSHYE